MNRGRLDRRALLGGAAATLALPWLEALAPRRAHAAGVPRRFIVFFTPGGAVPEDFWPSGSETTFTLPAILAPMEPWRKQLLLVDGVEMQAMTTGSGSEHQKGMGALLTGRSLPTGTFSFFGGPAGFPQGISIDQAIANKVGATTKHKSVELGILWPTYGNGPTPQNMLNYTGPQQPAPPMRDPWIVFQRLFGDFIPNGQAAAMSAVEVRKQQTKLLLDGTAQQYQSLAGKLGGEDRARLQEHLQRMREIRAALDRAPDRAAAGCSVPAVTREDGLGNYKTGGDGDGDSHYTIESNVSGRMPAIGKLMIDQLVTAFACDLTRVGTLQWTDAASRNSFPWLNLSQNHHFYQHDGGYRPKELTQVSRWYAEQLAYLCSRLAAVKEGDGTMLDSTVIFWGSEISHPSNHDSRRMPFLLAGGAGGAFRMGRHVKIEAPHNNLLVSLMNAYGVPGTTFGDSRFCTGPLSGLV